MTVKELIEKLSALNPDLPVMIRGYEGGVNDVNNLDTVKVKLNFYSTEEWYFGRHYLVFADSPIEDELKDTVDAIYLSK